MPIGFWSVSRMDVVQCVESTCKQRYGKKPQHTPKFHNLVDKICRTLPSALETCLDTYIEDAIINTYTHPLKDGEF